MQYFNNNLLILNNNWSISMQIILLLGKLLQQLLNKILIKFFHFLCNIVTANKNTVTGGTSRKKLYFNQENVIENL